MKKYCYTIHLFKQKSNTINSSLPSWIWEECARIEKVKSIDDVMNFFRENRGLYEGYDTTFMGLELEDNIEYNSYKITAKFYDSDLRCKNRSIYGCVYKGSGDLLENIITTTNSVMCYQNCVRVMVDKLLEAEIEEGNTMQKTEALVRAARKVLAGFDELGNKLNENSAQFALKALAQETEKFSAEPTHITPKWEEEDSDIDKANDEYDRQCCENGDI